MFKKLFGGGAASASASSAEGVSGAVLANAAMAWIDTCLAGMPEVRKIRDNLVAGGFRQEPDATAREAGDALALDSTIINEPIRDLHHTLWTGQRQTVPVVLMLTLAEAEEGQVVFVTALFGGAGEAEGVAVIERLTKSPPQAGGLAHAKDGSVVRRQFWRTPNVLGIRAMVLSGPEDVRARDKVRALIAFNQAV